MNQNLASLLFALVRWLPSAGRTRAGGFAVLSVAGGLLPVASMLLVGAAVGAIPAVAQEIGHATKLESGFGESLWSIVNAFGQDVSARVAGLGAAVLLFGFRWWTPLPIVACGLAFARAQQSVEWESHRWAEDHAEAERRAEYHQGLALGPAAAKEIRLFGLRDLIADRLLEQRMVVYREVWRLRRTRRGRLVVMAAAAAVAEIVAFVAIARAASSGELSVGRVAVFAQAVLGLWELTRWDPWWIHQGGGPIPHIERVAGLAATPLTTLGGSRSAAGMPHDGIRFDDVRFAYPGGSAVLDGLDLEIPAGASLAVVGLNGAGKTTLVKLLCRLHDPSSGRITVDGVDLREIDVGSWRTRVAAIFQDFVRYELPLRDNVDPSRSSSDELVLQALELAGAQRLAALDAPLSRAYRDGVDLSGGQWQKVAIARTLQAVLAGAGVLVLDEPTSNLDVRAEAELFDTLLKAAPATTTVLVSHRFSTVRMADLIVVIDDGRIVEIGSHSDLVARGGLYAELYGIQARAYS